MRKKTRRIAMRALGLLAASLPMQVVSQQQLERVEVTGSSIKRIEGEGALPVQVITREEIQKTGAATVEQLLQTISATTSSGSLATSSASGATTGSISAVSLRGLTSVRTLVLINGRRIAPYGIGFVGDSVSVDVNSLPLAAIERVEVLKDGASAIYGSDAIAGVINFILRREYQGAETTVEYGDTTEGGASLKRITGTVGFGDLSKDRYNVLIVGSYQKEQALFGRDRGFASSGINEGALNDTSSGNTFPANIVPVDGSFPTSNPTAPACPGPYSQLSPLFPATVCRFDPSPLVTLLPEAERASVFAAAKFALTNDLEAFAEASFNRNKIRTVIQPVPISDQFALPPNHPLFGVAPYNGFSTIILSASSPFYPTAYVQGITGGATPDLLVRWRAAAAGNRDTTDISEAPRLALGVRGAAAGWDFDSALVHSASKVRQQVNAGFPSLTQILPILNSGNVNFFGPNAAAIDAQIQATGFTGDAFVVKSSLTGLQGKASRELTRLAGGPLAIAVGAEARQEKFLFDPNPTIQTGDISGFGGNFLVTDRDRTVAAAFTEVNVPIAKGLEANAAVRFDKYQGVGNSTTPKLSVRWQPARPVLVRGAVGEGFRAPSLQDLYLPVTTGVTTPGLSDPQRCIPPLPAGTPGAGGSNDCQTQFPTTNGGNANLKPEESKNATFGIVLEPVDSVSVAVDYFRIKLKDTISNGFDAASILGDLATYGSLVTRGPVDPAFPNLPGPIVNINQTNINFGRTNVSGIDLDARWRLQAGDAGRFTLGLAGTYFIKFDTENPDGTFTGQVDQVNPLTGGVTPRWRHYLSLDWTRGPWSVTLAQNWQKGYHDLPGTFEDPSDPAFMQRRVGSYETYDLQTTYSGFKNMRLTLGARNLFDRDPPYTNSGGQTSFQGGYDPQYADPRGRFIYLRVNYAFW